MMLTLTKIIIRSLSLKYLIALVILTLILNLVLIIDLGLVNSLYTFYNQYQVQNKSSIMIMSYSVAPFTSLINRRNLDMLLHKSPYITGVEYHVLTIGLVDNHVIVVRGIEGLGSSSVGLCAWISRELAKVLEVSVGDVVQVYSIFSRSPLLLRICGYHTLNAPYKYELIVPYDIGCILRNVHKDYASVAIVHVREGVDASIVLRSLGLKELPKGVAERAILIVKYLGKKSMLRAYREVSEFYLSRFSLGRDSLLVMSIALALALSYTYYVLSMSLIHLIRKDIKCLHDLGVPYSKIKKCLIVLLNALITTELVIIYNSLTYISKLLDLKIINYEVQLYIDTPLLIAAIVILTAIIAFGVSSGVLHEVK